MTTASTLVGPLAFATTARSDDWKSTLVDAVVDVVDDRGSNPAVSAMLKDFVRFHAVMAVTGAMIASALLFFGCRSLQSYRRVRQLGSVGSRLERRARLGLAALFATLGLLCCLIALANVTNAIAPDRGLIGAIENSSTSSTSAVGRDAVNWVRSGSTEAPPAIVDAIDARLSWQRPKAIFCGVFSIGMIMISRREWRRMVYSARVSNRFGPRPSIALARGVASVFVAVLLSVMAVANAQAWVAPLTLSIFGGS